MIERFPPSDVLDRKHGNAIRRQTSQETRVDLGIKVVTLRVANSRLPRAVTARALQTARERRLDLHGDMRRQRINRFASRRKEIAVLTHVWPWNAARCERTPDMRVDRRSDDSLIVPVWELGYLSNIDLISRTVIACEIAVRLQHQMAQHAAIHRVPAQQPIVARIRRRRRGRATISDA